MNEFSKKSNASNNVVRSTHDLSFQNNLTLKFGAITPVFCREVLAGDSFRIEPTFGLRALPLVFPCQTRIKAYLHFFYVRNRTIWKDWMDFIFGTKSNLVSPYLSSNTSVRFRTSSLADYLGLPCVYYNTGSVTVGLFYVVNYLEYYTKSSGGTLTFSKSGYLSIDNLLSVSSVNVLYPKALYSVGETANPLTTVNSVDLGYPASLLEIPSNSGSITYTNSKSLTRIFLDADYKVLDSALISGNGTNVPIPKGSYYVLFLGDTKVTPSNITSSLLESLHNPKSSVSVNIPSSTAVSVDDLPVSNNIYRRSGGINPSSLPFRAYEAIYNAYYRNQQVEPLIVNGQPEYNKYITNYDSGGEDRFNYDLHYRNWEDDVFTTCLPSPQQGAAPMVGVTVNGQNQTSLAFTDADGNVYNAVPVLNSDKSGISSFTITQGTGSSVIPVSAALNSGITINDFRNVNALQRYLELSQLRGYRYKDLMDAHLNVDIRYNELMMPEFIGGCSRDINVSQITATANTSVDGVITQVGDYKAQAGLVGSCGSMTKYCDEHGFIIGLMMIVPVPVYGQQLAKHWLKRSQFDYFSPEFANIGLQAVKKQEIAPLNLNNADAKSTFGYQRPWYEYLSALDQSHGLFNTTIRNFLLNRSFGSQINLNGDFLHVDPRQLNDIFSSTLENDDKFLGEIYFKVTAKTAVPSSHLPRLE